MGAERALEGAENEWELRGSAVCACGACVRGARARTEKQGELTDIDVGASKVARHAKPFPIYLYNKSMCHMRRAVRARARAHHSNTCDPFVSNYKYRLLP